MYSSPAKEDWHPSKPYCRVLSDEQKGPVPSINREMVAKEDASGPMVAFGCVTGVEDFVRY